MPHRNRVTPTGEVIAVPLRGAWTGNRRIIHDGTQIVRFHGGDHWVTCALRFKDRHEQQWLPRRLTWLFSHDEAVALAAGHRPCGECRHHDYGAYRDAWAAELHVDPPTAKQMNRTLHGERMVKGTRRRRFHEMDWNDLPDGTFVLANQVPALVSDSHLVEWTEEGYRTRRPRPVHGQAEVITPPSMVAVLRHGYPAQVDEEAQPARQG